MEATRTTYSIPDKEFHVQVATTGAIPMKTLVYKVRSVYQVSSKSIQSPTKYMWKCQKKRLQYWSEASSLIADN